MYTFLDAPVWVRAGFVGEVQRQEVINTVEYKIPYKDSVAPQSAGLFSLSTAQPAHPPQLDSALKIDFLEMLHSLRKLVSQICSPSVDRTSYTSAAKHSFMHSSSQPCRVLNVKKDNMLAFMN